MSTLPANKASQNEYWSVDSQPAKLSGPVPLSTAPKLLVVFFLLSAIGLYLLNNGSLFLAAFPHGDWLLAPVSGEHFIAIRHFVFTFFLSFGLFCNGTAKQRARFTFDLMASFLVVCIVLDATVWLMLTLFEVQTRVSHLQIVTGLLGYMIFAARLFMWGEMPSPASIESHSTTRRKDFTRFWFLIFTAAILSWWVGQMEFTLITELREIALLGGLGPGVFLFLPLFFFMLYLFTQFDRIGRKGDPKFAPPITIVIPAHNEAYIIRRTIQSIDVAAGNYPGTVSVNLVNNNSSDATAEIAAKSFAEARHLDGHVLEMPTPGKSHALNAGFAAAKTEFSIRIDADTQVAPDALWRAMSHFKDDTLGCLGGVPMSHGWSFFERARQVEVFVNHGYYSIAAEAISGLVAVPGMFAVYRTKFIEQLGGFTFGLNGEDSEMSLRIGELGYRVSVDPRVHYISEVPASYTHMREQRMRWFRSAFHISARCREAMHIDNGSVRGALILPIMLFNTGARTMTLPLIIFGLIEYLAPFSTGIRPLWQAITAVVIGAPTIVAIFTILVNRAVLPLLYIPEYTAFRALRAYFTLESMLSITLADKKRSSGLHPENTRNH